MPEHHHITTRVPEELLERIEAYRRKLERLTRQPVSRAAAFRSLLEAGLEAVEGEE